MTLTPMIRCSGTWIADAWTGAGGHAPGCPVLLLDGDPMRVSEGISPMCLALTKLLLAEQRERIERAQMSEPGAFLRGRFA